MTKALSTLIGESEHDPFRRAYIKRKQTADGLFESTWTEITKYVKRWGTIESSIDDVRFNRFIHSGFDFVGINDEGKFNPETDPNSLWNGYLTRYNTLVKVEGGYKDGDTELPTNPTLGIFVISDEIPKSGRTNDVPIRCKSLVSIFDEVKADEVTGLGVTATASELIAKIRDHTDGAGAVVFRQFISSASWVIQSTTVNYNLATTTSQLENLTVWDLMNKLAETEGYVLLINRTGGVEFRNRTERTTTSQFDFYGQGYPNMNIISLDESKEALNKYYNVFRLKFDSPDTSASYVEAGTTTIVDASSTSWKYGNRIYTFESRFFNTQTTAQTVVNNLYTTFNTVAEEVGITAKFHPSLEVLDKVNLSYRSYDLAGATVWDQFDWASDMANLPQDAEWADESGENFDYDQAGFKILKRKTNLEDFTTEFNLRRI